MTVLNERELLRARWRRALAAHALDCADRDDFARAGLARRLRDVTTQVLILPADPEAAVVDFGQELDEWLTLNQVVQIDDLDVRMASSPNIRRTADATALTDGYDATWNSYVAVHRSGALELGMGHLGGWEWRNNQDDQVRIIALSPLVARTWAMLNMAADLAAMHDLAGPFQVSVGVRSHDAHLGMLAEGWAEPDSFGNSVSTCPEQTLLWHLELEATPNMEGARDVAYGVGDRLEDAWGVVQRRYLASRGEREGRLDSRRIN